MPRTPSRRQFLQHSALAGAGFWIAGSSLAAESKSPNEKLNLVSVGCGGRAGANLSGCASQNYIGLCDVDEQRAASAFNRFPKAAKFKDFRVMLDKLENQIDGVLVSTPDHLHAPAAVMAMKMGKHVYCEKPLAHSVYECRVMAETAAKMKVATQMGNQGHSGRGYRQMVEIVQAGGIGNVREAHAFCPKNFSANSRPTGDAKVPATLDWDLWVGPAPMRPYNPAYLPFNWRRWWDFGTGGLGDMACHIIDPIFWGLKLDAPISVEADGDPESNPEGFASDLTVKYEFGPRGDLPPVTLYWHHGNRRPSEKLAPGVKLPGSGQLLIGDKGIMIGQHSSGLVALLPEDKFADYQKPEAIYPSPSGGHHGEWITACKEGTPTGSNFQYGAALSETVLLGNVAHRVGEKLEWDSKNLKATNCPAADELIRREYRQGWTL